VQTLSLIWGILALVGMLVFLFPCLGALNWVNIPFAGLGLIFSVIALATGKEGNRGGSIAGTVCCGLAVLVGIIRLFLGGGII
jgi:hypothetical protein